MRIVKTNQPSFPDATVNKLLSPEADKIWQVACGDSGHWRCGFYSPEFSTADDITELEEHDCPELFMLVEGRVNLLLSDDSGEHILELLPLKPVLVTCRHSGFCPDGAHSGSCIVIERDVFTTTYTRR